MTTATADPRRLIYQRPELLDERSSHYCPGCGHGIVHRMVAESLDELSLAQLSGQEAVAVWRPELTAVIRPLPTGRPGRL